MKQTNFWYSITLFLWVFAVRALPIAKRSQDSSRPKKITAHVIIGNVYNYTEDTWESDINLAQEIGVDAFALNMGTDSWQVDRIEDA